MCASSSLKKITGVGDDCTSVGDQEKMLCKFLYRYQSTGGFISRLVVIQEVLYRFSAGISQLVVPVSRLIVIQRVGQSTDGASQSTGSCPETSPVD